MVSVFKDQGFRLRAAARKAGFTQASKLAAGVGMKASTVRSLMNGTRKLTANTAARLGDFLKADKAYLLYGTGQSPTGSGPKPQGEAEVVDNPQRLVEVATSGRAYSASGTTSFLDQPRDLPILGSVRAGKVGFFLDQGEIQGMARRPPILQGIKNAFAVYIRDVSMVPALRPNHVAWVHPTRPEIPGENCIIEFLDGQAFVKEYRKKTEKHIICWQYNPAGEVRYDRKKVKSVMLVVGSCIEE